MAKRRVYEIAKEMGISSDELVAKLREAGLEIKSRLVTVDEDEARNLLKGAAKAAEKNVDDAADKPETPEENSDDKPKQRKGFMIIKKAAVKPAKDKEPVVKAEEKAENINNADVDIIKAAGKAEEEGQAVVGKDNIAPVTAKSEVPLEGKNLAKNVVNTAHDVETPVGDNKVAAESDGDADKPAPVIVKSALPEEPEKPAHVAVNAETSEKKEPKNNDVFVKQPVPVVKTASSVPTATTAPVAPVASVPPAAPVINQAASATQTAPASAPAQLPGSRVIRVIDREKLIERMQANRGGPRGGQRPGSNGPQGGGRPGYQNNGERRPGQGGGYQGGERRGYNSQSSVPTMSLDEMAKVSMALSQVTEVNMRERRRANDYDHDNFDQDGMGRGGRRQQFTKRDLMEMRERVPATSRLRKKKVHKGPVAHTQITEVKESKRVIKIEDRITVADLAQRLGIKAAAIIKQLMGLGMMVTTNDYIDLETAQLVADEYSYRVENVSTTEEELLDISEDKPEDLEERPPVVTVMGHVDHGKTSLLDAIRASDVAKHEHGGITQHIGAYSVATPSGTVTFIDTPGHAAFTAMRARGAQVTDIVVLVVAADDGVMPQTIEAINHAQAAKVPIIVAVNKCDLPGANPERVMQALTEYGLVAEEWGGETIFVKTAAVKGEGVSELLESILLQAEMLELTANPHKAASGVVIEAQLDKGRGPVATVLVQDGTLKIGDYVIAGSAYGKVRALVDARGSRLKEAGPAVPVEIQGLNAVPTPGDSVNAVESLDKAKELAEMRINKAKDANKSSGSASLEELLAKMGQEGKKELKVVVKADVQGSMEALKETIGSQANDEVEVKVIHAGVGAITESDVILAAASKAIIVGFNVRPDAKAAALAETEHVDVKTYRVIYDVLDDIQAAMNGMLRPVISEKVLGRAQVLQTFKVPKVGTIAGCKVISGKVTRTAEVRLLRDNIVVFEGKIASLRHLKDDVREVQSGHECGIGIENYQDIHLGDVLEAFVMEESSAS